MYKRKVFLIIWIILLHSYSVFAQQIQVIPIGPVESANRVQHSIQQQVQSVGQIQPAKIENRMTGNTFIKSPSYIEEASEVEKFMSEVTEIDEVNFEVLKKFPGISFTYSTKEIPRYHIAVPIRIIKKTLSTIHEVNKKEIIDAGFLVGPHEAIYNAFKMLGIRSPLVPDKDLKQFGYDLFINPPSTFAPVDNVPVGPDYVIGPGDEIKISVWGNIEGSWSVVVDRDGKISLPRIGTIGVTGLTFNELKELLYREFSKYYKGFEMNVTMGALRTIRVYVVGHAQRPGAYTVSSLSTLVNALFEAGGPSKTGTMRDIQLKRNGKTIVHFDMYDFLLKGDKTKDVRLMPEDVIFIPPVGPLVGIAGNVKRPAIYELKGETKLLDLIQMAGGLTSSAYKGRVQVFRVEDQQFRTIFESDLVDIEKDITKNFTLKDGDLVKIYSVVDLKTTMVVSGAVANPGEYGITPGLTRVKDVISLAGGLLYYASNYAEITRVKPTQEGPKVERINIDLSKAIADDPKHNILLEINDYLFVRTIPEWDLYKTVTISGEVRYPGTYTIKKGERLSSLIERAGGFTDKAYLKGAVFTRERIRELQQRQINEMVDRLEKELLSFGTAEASTALSPEEAKIIDFEIKQKREFISKLRNIKAKGRMVIKIDVPERLKNTVYDIELEDGDSIYIPPDPKSIQVIGAVYNQTAFVYQPDKSPSYYINLAGGFTENADKKNIYILKVDGTAVRLGSSFELSWNKESNRWEFGSAKLDPGDTIVVPERLQRIAWLRNIKDITQILYQIAVTAGVLITVF